MMKICYFGIYNPTYPRNKIIRNGLELNNIKVIECRTNSNYSRIKQYYDLWRKLHSNIHGSSFVIVAESNRLPMFIAYWIAHKIKVPVIFDPYVSMYDTIVNDRKNVKPNSIKAIYSYYLDKICLNFANIIIADTQAMANYYNSTFNINKPMKVIPVGADSKIFHPVTKIESCKNFIVAWWGTYIPLHGVDVILKAAQLLQNHKDIIFEFYGTGQTRSKIQTLNGRLKLDNTKFSKESITENPNILKNANVCLGIFGKTQKANRVIPNKVFESIATAKVCITGDSPSINEFFTHKKNIFLVKMNDPKDLAKGILFLKNNKTILNEIKNNGYELYRKNFTPEIIGSNLKIYLSQLNREI